MNHQQDLLPILAEEVTSGSIKKKVTKKEQRTPNQKFKKEHTMENKKRTQTRKYLK